MILTLQDIVLNYIIQNFDEFFKNKIIFEEWLQSDIPPLFTRKILENLDDWIIGIPEEYLTFCTKSPCFSNTIELNCKRIKQKSSLKFLQGQRLRKVILKNLKNLRIDDWMPYLDCEELKELSIRGCKINNQETTEKCSNVNIEFMSCFKPFKHLISLNLSFTNVCNAEFKFIANELSQIEELNISHTSLTNLCSLTKFRNLYFLDCSFPRCKSVYDSYLILLELRKLKYLDISRKSPKLVNCNPYQEKENEIHLRKIVCLGIAAQKFLYQKSWSISDFIESAHWQDMTYLNVSGEWKVSLQSIG